MESSTVVNTPRLSDAAAAYVQACTEWKVAVRCRDGVKAMLEAHEARVVEADERRVNAHDVLHRSTGRLIG